MKTSYTNIFSFSRGDRGFQLTAEWQLLGIFLSAMLMVFIPMSVSAVGIAPGVVRIPTILTGTTHERTVTIFRDLDSQEEVVFNVEPRGDNAKYFSGPAQLIIPENEGMADYTFQINAQDAAVGDYELFVPFNRQIEEVSTEDTGETAEGTIGASFGVAAGVTARVEFTVTGDQIVDYEVSALQLRNTEIDQPAFINFFVKNTGNVDWSPDRLELTFKNLDDETYKSGLVIDGSEIPLFVPGFAGQVFVPKDHTLPVGTYIAKGKVFYGDEKAHKLESQQFSVFAPGTLRQRGDFLSLATNKVVFEPGEKVKVEAGFENTGEIGVSSLLVVEVFKGDEAIDLIRGNEFVVDVNGKIDLSEFVTLDKSGKYTLTAYIEYGNRKTESQSIDIEVLDAGWLPSNIVIVVIGALAIVIVIIVVVAARKQKKITNKIDATDRTEAASKKNEFEKIDKVVKTDEAVKTDELEDISESAGEDN